MENKNR